MNTALATSILIVFLYYFATTLAIALPIAMVVFAFLILGRIFLSAGPAAAWICIAAFGFWFYHTGL